VPVGAEAFCLQALYRPFSQVTVLEAAAGQHDTLLAGPPRDGNDGFD